MTAAGIARQVRDGNLSPIEVTEAYLDRIHKREDRTNAFTTVTEQLAKETAREAQAAINEGEILGPLHGVPVAIKDLDDVEDVRTTSGSLLFKKRIAEEDAPFVTRLKKAGAIIVGKTNTPEFGLGTTTDNRVTGATGTPFDPDRVAGGSSGGSGAAVGDSLVPIAQGSDAGGSIRIPASFCGVYGLKPTFGLVPSARRPNAFAHHTPFSHQGPMAQTVEDAALMLDVIAGAHPNDPFSFPTQNDYQSATKQSVDDMKIAYSVDMGIYPVAPDVSNVVNKAVTALNDVCTVDRVNPELGHTQREIMDAFYTMATVRWQSLFDNLEEQGFDPKGEDRSRLRPYLVDLVMEAEEPTTREYKQADLVRTNILDSMNSLFEEYDLLVTASTSITPFLHDREPTEVDGIEIEPLRGWLLTQPFNFTGNPAASIPAGFVDDLPVGMQIVGQHHDDKGVIAASAAFERQRPWHEAYPN